MSITRPPRPKRPRPPRTPRPSRGSEPPISPRRASACVGSVTCTRYLTPDFSLSSIVLPLSAYPGDRRGPMRRTALVFLLAGSLAGCAIYREQPLSTRPTLPDRIPNLSIDPRQMPLPELAAHRFDPADGLDITEAAMLAVVNNPDLKTARAAAGIAHAQAFAAGLLPDPQLSLGVDVPDAGQAGTVTAYHLGLSYDVIALLTQAPRRAAAQREAAKT